MSKSFFFAFASLTFLYAAPLSAQAATVLTLGPSSRCATSGCFGDNVRSFTQSFSSNGGSIDIGSLRLFKGIVGDMQDYAVRISFQRADGTVVGEWGSYLLAILAGEFVNIDGKAFTWNAADGDLILKLDLIAPGRGGNGFSSAGSGFSGLGGSFSGGSTFGQGLVNRAGPDAPPLAAASADILAVGAIPEPMSWALMIAGFGMAGAMLRRHGPAREGYKVLA